MKKFIVSAATIAALAVPASTVAAGHSQNGPTVGDCISDGLYGNEPNMANGAPGGPSEQEPGTKGGNVLPTQSPGPFVNNPNDPDNPTRGRSVGQWQQDGVNVPEFCRAATGQSPPLEIQPSEARFGGPLSSDEVRGGALAPELARS